MGGLHPTLQYASTLKLTLWVKALINKVAVIQKPQIFSCKKKKKPLNFRVESRRSPFESLMLNFCSRSLALVHLILRVKASKTLELKILQGWLTQLISLRA